VHKLHENTADGEAADAIDSDGNGRVDDFLGWDFDDDDRLPFDYNDFLLNINQSYDHGTHVGGIAAQGTEDVRLLPVRWKISGPALAAGVDYMAARGARVVNMSFSSTSKSTMDPLGAKIAAQPDLLFVAAAGNDGEDLELKVRYPASFTADNLIVVAAVDDKGALTSWSNWGAVSCDVAAPGDAIFNTVVGGGWGTKSGTSMATPFVVNVAAKMLALAPELTPKQVKAALMATVDVRADFTGKMISKGVINAARAMRVAWLWQRMRDGQVGSTAIAALGLPAAEASRIVALATAL
jgi:subtilisin family serine protease